jgi:hypothetical protein
MFTAYVTGLVFANGIAGICLAVVVGALRIASDQTVEDGRSRYE